MELRPPMAIRSGGLSLATGASNSPEMVELVTTRNWPPGGECSARRTGSSAAANEAEARNVRTGSKRMGHVGDGWRARSRATGARHSRPVPHSQTDRTGHLGEPIWPPRQAAPKAKSVRVLRPLEQSTILRQPQVQNRTSSMDGSSEPAALASSYV